MKIKDENRKAGNEKRNEIEPLCKSKVVEMLICWEFFLAVKDVNLSLMLDAIVLVQPSVVTQ